MSDKVAVDDRLPFRVELTTPFLGQAVVAVQGELDLFTAPRLHEALVQAIALGAHSVVADLADVTFIDSTALGVLIDASKQLRVCDGSLAIAGPNGSVRRVLELTGLDRIIDVRATCAAAQITKPSA